MLFLIQAHWQGVMNFDLAISAKDNHQANNVTTERKVHVLCCVQYCCWPRIKPWECSLPSGLHCPPYGTNSTNWEHSTQLTYHSASAFAFGFSLSKLGRSATLYHCIVVFLLVCINILRLCQNQPILRLCQNQPANIDNHWLHSSFLEEINIM